MNDLRIRKWRNFLPRHWINLQIRAKNMEIRFLLPLQAKAAARANSGSAIHKSDSVRLAVAVSPFPLLGHQVSSWIAGYLWARELGVTYVGGVIPADGRGLFDFSGDEDRMKADGERTILARAVHDERDGLGIPTLRHQVEKLARKRKRPSRLLLRPDPQWWDQIPAAPAVRRALLKGYRGRELELLESEPYIAVHVRRGEDIDRTTTGGDADNASVQRWVDAEYYFEVVESLLSDPQLESMNVILVSVEELIGFERLTSHPRVIPRIGGDRDEDLVTLAAASVLVTSPSSFSFTAALASKGVVLCRHPWWHNVPDTGRWIRVGHNGEFNQSELASALEAPRNEAS